MSWLFSQALVEEYSEGICSDGKPSVQSSGSLTPQAYLCSDKMMGFSRLSRFGMTFRLLTESRGEALLMSYLEGFHAKTSQPQERVQGLTESDQGCGEKWQGSFAKYDPDTHSLRTHQCSLLEDLMSSCQTLPAWGLMRDGECWEQPTLELRIKGTESGLWPTPTCNMVSGGPNHNSPQVLAGKHGINLAGAVMKWRTPQSADSKSTIVQKGYATNLTHQIGGKLNPTWVEWLMGWPLEWTDLKPLEMGKFQQWQQQHGSS
jgi:hypothetical protein